MATEPREDKGQDRQGTEYAPTSRSGAKPGFVLSAWALVLGTIALVVIISGLLAS